MIYVTGNTVIDALLAGVKILDCYKNDEIISLENQLHSNKKIILVTGHRRENFGGGFINICDALIEISKNEDVDIIYPVHLNPNVQKVVHKKLDGIKNIHLINPLSYPAFLWLMKKSYIILTDSGGVQEEAPSLGIPVLVMRDTTERPEGVDAGTAILVGTNKDNIISFANKLINEKDFYNTISVKKNPYGDGKASKNIVELLKEYAK